MLNETTSAQPNVKHHGLETLSRILQSARNSRVYSVSVLYIVYRTIEKNPDITINQLRHLLQQEYFIPFSATEGSLASLSSAKVWGCVTRWKKPEDSIDKTHFHLKPGDMPTRFSDWINSVIIEFPGLLSFQPPELVRKSHS
jgi:hypothetical protein